MLPTPKTRCAQCGRSSQGARPQSQRPGSKNSVILSKVTRRPNQSKDRLSDGAFRSPNGHLLDEPASIVAADHQASDRHIPHKSVSITSRSPHLALGVVCGTPSCSAASGAGSCVGPRIKFPSTFGGALEPSASSFAVTYPGVCGSRVGGVGRLGRSACVEV